MCSKHDISLSLWLIQNSYIRLDEAPSQGVLAATTRVFLRVLPIEAANNPGIVAAIYALFHLTTSLFLVVQ